MVEIIVKNKEKTRAMGYRAFFSPVDKGSAKPAFCYPAGINNLKETISDMERNLNMGNVAPEQRMQYEANLRKHKDRLTEINDGHDNAKKIYEADKDYYDRRADDLKKEITKATPTKADIKDRMVNPHTILRQEVEGLKDKKLEYQTIQHLRGEDSNLTYLQKRK